MLALPFRRFPLLQVSADFIPLTLVSGFMPREDAMKPYSSVELSVTNDFSFGRKWKDYQTANRIDTAIKIALWELSLNPKRQSAFMDLLACARARTSWLQPTPGQGSAASNAPIFFINRLRNVAARQNFWMRSLESWLPGSASPRLAFRSLVHHLFAKYPVPGFMDSVWDLPAGSQGFGQQVWYIRLGRGAMLRSLSLPFPLTRHMEHCARQAPDHYTAIQALRYGESRGLGCSELAAREIATSRLGRETANPSFWRTVIMFFAAHPALPLEDIQPTLEFVYDVKFAAEGVLTPEGAASSVPPWPHFTMKGRTPESLLRLVRAWNLEANTKLPNGFSWPQLGVAPYRYVERRADGLPRDWMIVELLNSGALFAEGRAMRHCVYTYVQKCFHGKSSIWSLRLRIGEEQKRLATIEVDPKEQAIVQVRTKRNRYPSRRLREIIHQWAAQANLSYDENF